MTARKPVTGTQHALAQLHDRGRTDTDLGAALCVSAGTVWRWRTGRVNPHPELARRIKRMAALLGR